MVTEGGYGLMAVIAAGVCECKERCGQCHCVILPLIKDDRFAVSVRLYLPAPPLIFNHNCSPQLRFLIHCSGVNKKDERGSRCRC